MNLSERVVLSLLVAMLQLLAFLWACRKLSILWIIVMLWTLCISLCKNVIPSRMRTMTFNEFHKEFRIIYVIALMIGLSEKCYKNPNPESWDNWCHLDVLLFPNIKRMLETLLEEFFCFSLFFLRLARNAWMRISKHRWHYARCILGFSICVLIFLCLIDWIAITSMSFTNSALNGGVKYSNNKPLLYPTVYREKEYELNTRVRYISSFEETLVLKQGKFTTQKEYQPLTYERYNGEDIKIDCNFVSNIGLANHKEYYWSLNGVRLRKIAKRNSNISMTTIDSYSWIVSMTLTIPYIDNTDYGVYGCVEESVYSITYDQNLHIAGLDAWSSYGIQVDSVVKMEMHIKRQQPFVEVKHLLPSDTAFFLGHEFLTADDSWVSYEYTINDISYNPSFTEIARCSIYLRILHIVSYLLEDPYNAFKILDLEYINGIERDDNIQDISRYVTSIRFCSNPNVFGWHKLTYFRERFNTRTNRTEIVEYPNPVIRLVLPEPKKSILFSFLDDTELYHKMETEIKGNGHMKAIDEFYLSVYRSNELKARYIHDSASIVSLILILTILTHIPNLYCRFIFKPTMHFLLPLNVQGSDSVSNSEGKTHDVFVAHSDEDYSWVTKVLAPHLEENLGLTMFLPDRDFHHGNTVISATERALNDCKIILICLTDSYLQEPGSYRLQVEHLLLPNLYDKEIPSYKIVVLNFRREAIPQPLRWNSDIVAINWMSLPESECLRMLDSVVHKYKVKKGIMCPL